MAGELSTSHAMGDRTRRRIAAAVATAASVRVGACRADTASARPTVASATLTAAK